MDSESEGAGGSPGGDRKSKAASSADTSKWPISLAHSKVSECCLCSARSTDPNPLVVDVQDAEAMEGHRPWAKYRKVPKHSVRVPEGKCCLPCLNVFRLLGKDSKYGTYQVYYKHISQKANQAAQNEHKDFLAAVKQWLKQHKENPEKFKLKSKEDLMKTQRQLVISKKSGGKLTGPKKQFVLSTHWDPVRHGEWDPAKEVEHWVDGAFRKGVWRNTGPEGVYDYEAYEDTGVEERVIEDDGQQELFAEEAFQAKKQAALETMQKQARERDAASVKATENDMTFADLVQVVTSLGQSSSSSAAVPLPDGASGKEAGNAVAETVDESSDSSSSSSGEEEQVATGLNLLRGSAPKRTHGEAADATAKGSRNQKPKAKAKAKETVKASTQAKTVLPSKPGGADKGEKKVQEIKVSNPVATAGPEGAGMLSLDGRANRTLKTLESAIQQAKEALGQVSFKDPLQSSTQMKAFRSEASERVAKLTGVVKKAKETVTRVGKSANKDSFQKQLDDLQDLGDFAASCAKLLTNVTATSLDADAYIEAHTAASSKGADLGPLYSMKLVVAHSQKHLLYGKYKEFCQEFLPSSLPTKQLVDSLGLVEASKHCALEVENRMLASLRAIPANESSLLSPEKAPKDLTTEAPRMNESLELADAIVSSCTDASEGFMAMELAEAASTVRALLGQDNVGMLFQQVQGLQALAQTDLDSVPALQKFFLQHDTGKAFFAMAQLKVEQGDQEKLSQDKLKALQTAVAHLTSWPKQCAPEAESGILAVEKRVEPAVSALAEVKKTPFHTQWSKKKKKDQASSCSSLFGELEALEKQLSSGCCELVRFVCKENMDNHMRLACNAPT